MFNWLINAPMGSGAWWLFNLILLIGACTFLYLGRNCSMAQRIKSMFAGAEKNEDEEAVR